jgi:hypothetical protein
MNGYEQMHRLGIEARADMLESVAGMDRWRVLSEIGFACAALDVDDAATLRWLACLCERRVDDLSA